MRGVVVTAVRGGLMRTPGLASAAFQERVPPLRRGTKCTAHSETRHVFRERWWIRRCPSGDEVFIAHVATQDVRVSILLGGDSPEVW